jgi:hypothetical protein
LIRLFLAGLPGSDAANPAYTFYLYVADTTKTKPYAPPPVTKPDGSKNPDKEDWNKHVKDDWDRSNIGDAQTKGQIGGTAPTLPPGTVSDPPEAP